MDLLDNDLMVLVAEMDAPEIPDVGALTDSLQTLPDVGVDFPVEVRSSLRGCFVTQHSSYCSAPGVSECIHPASCVRQ
jgi:hypothetical protein